VDLRNINPQETNSISLVFHALRDTRLTDSLLYIKGWDTFLTSEEGQSFNLEEIYRHPGFVILAGKKVWQAEGFQRDRKSIWIDFPVPGYLDRKQLWSYYLSPYPVEAGMDVSYLAGQFQLTSGKIRDAVQTAADKAFSYNRPIEMNDLFKAARLHSNPRLVNLAHKIEPRYSWEDIILPADQIALLKEISATVRGRPKVLDEWGVGRKLASSRGVTVLFAGPPGTGKTMAAEVIALELHLDLYKIDLSTIVSKYIGETEKNLERIFSEAESSSAILFFDEADSLFGKRSEVRDSHDRYANIEISYLLQRMEAYDGVTILATNLRSNLDEAFTRRLQFAVDFPFPEAPDRLRIWTTLFPAGVPKAEDINFELLSKRFRLAGGNIRNIIVSAAYLAASDGCVVEMSHLLHGARRELQKMGRLVSEMDFTITPPPAEE
jgi:AAA+ superfamily predicted ATPase